MKESFAKALWTAIMGVRSNIVALRKKREGPFYGSVISARPYDGLFGLFWPSQPYNLVVLARAQARARLRLVVIKAR